MKRSNNESDLHLSTEELKEFLSTVKNLAYVSRYFTYMRDNIESSTSFLDQSYKKISFTNRVKCILNDIASSDDIPLCPICANPVNLHNETLFAKTCGNRVCQNELRRKSSTELWENMDDQKREGILENRKKTNLSRYGTDNPLSSPIVKEKIKQTCIERYGSERYQSSGLHSEYMKEMWETMDEKKRDSILTNRKIASNEKYGTDVPSQSEVVKEKIKKSVKLAHEQNGDKILEARKKTNNIRYGVDDASMTDEFKERIKNTNMERYGASHKNQQHVNIDILDNPELLTSLFKDLGIYKLSEMCRCHYTTVYNYMDKYDIPVSGGKSVEEGEVADYIENVLGFDIERNYGEFFTDRRNVDIYIPSKKIAIEYDGIYYHSSKFKENSFHIDKTNECDNHGVRLIHIFSDEWVNTPEIVKKKLKNILGKDDSRKVFARKTEIHPIDNAHCKKFLEDSHIQGHNGATHSYALKHEGEVVAIMMFKLGWSGEFELTRYATNCRVIGGFSKLLKHFLQTHKDVAIIESFADRRWSNGDVYAVNGFTHVKTGTPDYYFIIGGKRVKRSSVRRDRMHRLIDNYDPSISMTKNMESNGIHRIYDCGLMKFSLNNPYYKEREDAHD